MSIMATAYAAVIFAALALPACAADNSEKFVLVNGNGDLVMTADGFVKLAWMKETPQYRPLFFDTAEDARAAIEEHGYNQFTRVGTMREFVSGGDAR